MLIIVSVIIVLVKMTGEKRRQQRLIGSLTAQIANTFYSQNV